MTQADRVLEYLERNGSITSRDAILELGVIQLPRRIYDLRHRGVPIRRIWRRVPNRYGEQVRIGVYSVGGGK